MKKLLIIPAYNEEKNIENTIKKLLALNNPDIDYIIINDGSTDNTLAILDNNNFNYLTLPINLGIGGAVQTGYKYALYNNYDIAIQFDGDGQHNVEYISQLIQQVEAGNDLVIGSRFLDNLTGFKSTKTRRIGIKLLSNLIKLCTGKKITDPTSGFRACNRKIIELKKIEGERRELIVKLTDKGKEYTDRVLKDLYEMEKRVFDRISKKSDQILEDLNSLYQELENEKEND